MPTALSTPFASISLHKAHKLLKSETHGNITRGKLHFTLHLRDQHHAQMKFQLLHPLPDDRSAREHRGLEGRKEPRTTRAPGAGRGRLHKHTPTNVTGLPQGTWGSAEHDANCMEKQFCPNLYIIL